MDERKRETTKGKFAMEMNDRMKDVWRGDGNVGRSGK